MVLTKLNEVLAEIEGERKRLDNLESQLRSMIAGLSGTTTSQFQSRSSRPQNRETKTQLEEIADILRAEGKPLHIKIIAERLSALRLKKVERGKIEPGVTRHISSVKQPLIAKFGPSTYGLPEWKNEQPTLAQIA